MTSFEALRLNVMVTRETETGPVFHVDTLDLYSARAMAVFTKAAAAELDLDEAVIHADPGRVVLACGQAVLVCLMGIGMVVGGKAAFWGSPDVSVGC